MKLMQFGYKSSKVFMLFEFLLKVYEVDTIWIQRKVLSSLNFDAN